MKRTLAAAVVLIAGTAVAACGGSSAADADVVENYAAGVYASYLATLESARAMDGAIDAFIAAPSEEALAAARSAWLTARDDYGPTEAFRFYGGPIDGEDGVEGMVNAWPLDEAYIDYVEGDPSAGIVNRPDEYPTIDAELLMSLNEAGGETNIATGWHAIEFLLWGQDLSGSGPGARPASDYTTAANADRRAAYLAVASDLLVGHLQELVDAWAPDSDNYRSEFVAMSSKDALAMIITGIGELSLGELAGERLTVAYEERSQEDEHSCFSDNTTNDIVANAVGIQRVVTGDYGAVSGPGIVDLVAAEDEELASELGDDVDASVTAARAVPAPFDQHLGLGIPDDDPGRMAILDTITHLEAQADTISEGAAAIEVTLG